MVSGLDDNSGDSDGTNDQGTLPSRDVVSAPLTVVKLIIGVGTFIVFWVWFLLTKYFSESLCYLTV